MHLGTVDGADTILQPDLLVAPRAAFTDGALPVAPVLVVEILSPSHVAPRPGRQRDAYAMAGVQRYWVVAPDTPSVTVYRLGVDGAYREEAHLTGEDTWTVTAPVQLTLCPADLLR